MKRMIEPTATSPSTPVIDGDLAIGLTEEEARELAALKGLSLDAEPLTPAAMEGGDEENIDGQVSPVTSLPVRTSRGELVPGELTVRLHKQSGVDVGLRLKRAGMLSSAIEIASVAQGSMLLNECSEGDVLLSINGKAFSDADKAAKALTAAGGDLVLGVKRAARSRSASAETVKAVSSPRARYSLSAMLGGRNDGASLLASQ